MLSLHKIYHSGLAAFAVYRQRPVLVMLFLGFSAGLPLLLVFSTLTAWLRDEDVSRATIGFFAWVGTTYSIKFIWSPIVDRLPLPVLSRVLGKRRAWLLLSQGVIVVSLLSLSALNPKLQLVWVAVAAVAVAFASATQDIVIDAFRIESADENLQGAAAATYVFGYRVALLVAGAGALLIADSVSWSFAYQCMAAAMAVGVITTLLIDEPLHRDGADSASYPILSASWWHRAVVLPFVDFFRRAGWFSLVILLFIGLFRLSDIVMGIMANPFYLDLGFTKSEIATIGKVYGFAMTLMGSFLGGAVVAKLGVYRPLLIGAVSVAMTNLLFAYLARVGPDIQWLMVTISADNLCAGFAGVAFIAYLSSLTNRSYTATQYALFSSLMTLPGKLVSGFSGVVVDGAGYVEFFIYAAIMGIPAIVLSLWVIAYSQKHNAPLHSH